MTKFFVLLFLLLSTVFSLQNLNLKRIHSPLNEIPPHLLSPVQRELASSNLPVGGNIFPLGIFYTEIGLGTPSKKYQVAIDTGSMSLAVSETGCNGCRAPNSQLYDPSASQSAVSVSCSDNCQTGCISSQCSFTNSYETCNITDPTQPCTIKGLIYEDLFALGSIVSKDKVRLGAIDFQTANFQQFYVIHGVMGVAKYSDSNFGGTNPIDILYNQKLISDDFFTICLANNTGTITIGGSDSSLQVAPPQYTPRKPSILYVIDMTDILVGSTSIGVSPSVYANNNFGGTVVDSGTNILLVPEPAFNGIQSTMVAYCQKYSIANCQGLFQGQCYSNLKVSAFPSLQLDINGVLLNMTAENYLLPQTNGGPLCLAIKNTGPNGFTIIGDTTMTNYYVSFERDRLGWAPVNPKTCFSS